MGALLLMVILCTFVVGFSVGNADAKNGDHHPPGEPAAREAALLSHSRESFPGKTKWW